MAPNLDLVLACYAAILLMQLTLALALGSQQIDSQVLQAIFPALVELTVKIRATERFWLEIWHILGFPAPFSRPLA